MNTTEQNKTIDTFMESKGEYISYKDQGGGECWGEYKPNKYNSDWGLLMGVVDKIESLDSFFGSPSNYQVKMENNHCCIQSNEVTNWEQDILGVGEAKKETVYDACVKFITWYNQQVQNIENDKLIERMHKESGWDNRFPFEEGDDYYTVENNNIIWSCWDDQSEIFHDEDPNKAYYNSVGEAVEYLKTTNYTEANVYDYGTGTNNYIIKLK